MPLFISFNFLHTITIESAFQHPLLFYILSSLLCIYQNYGTTITLTIPYACKTACLEL